MKILVDIPDELYDAIQNKTLHLTSGSRSNGKHLVYELIGCVMNGEIITDIQNSNNVVHQGDELTFVTGMSTDADKPIPECETWSNDQNPIKIKYGEKNLVDFTKLVYNEAYPFTDPVDGRHYRVAYDGITKEYAD